MSSLASRVFLMDSAVLAATSLINGSSITATTLQREDSHLSSGASSSSPRTD